MKISQILVTLLAAAATANAQVRIDEQAFGLSLGGWDAQGGKAAQYPLSGSNYRTFRPECTPTPDGGIFVSIRIDHVRGIFSSNDHATLELTVDAEGGIESARSNIAIQGQSIASDVIQGGAKAGQVLGGVDRAVQIGTDLVANLSAKLLREKVVESGRVTFPAAVRHNYNLLYQAIRVGQPPVAEVVEPSVQAAGHDGVEDQAVEDVGDSAKLEADSTDLPDPPVATPVDSNDVGLEIQPYRQAAELDPRNGNP